MILRTLKEVRLNGKVILPGGHISTKNPKQFLQRGYARKLTRNETRAIIDGYVQEAKRMFNDTSRQQNPSIKHVQGILFNNGD